MGQKVNPHGLRVGVIKNWDSRWFAKDEVFGDTLVSDYKIRKYLKAALQEAGVPKIEIERDSHRVRVFIHCAKPGMVIGRGGSEIEKYKNELEKMVKMPVSLNVVEVRQPDLDAQLVAENICGQLERRISFRRAMKMAIRNTMRLGAKGIKISCSGRLAGAEIARTEKLDGKAASAWTQCEMPIVYSNTMAKAASIYICFKSCVSGGVKTGQSMEIAGKEQTVHYGSTLKIDDVELTY